MVTAILVVNLVASLASAAWGLLALVRPQVQSRSATVDRGEQFYARMYAARAVPLGIGAGVLPFGVGHPAAVWVVFIAGAVQLADVAVAVAKKDRGMGAGALLATLVHVAAGVVLLSR